MPLFRIMCLALVTFTVAGQSLKDLKATAASVNAAIEAAKMKQDAGGKRSVQIRSDDGDVVIEAGKDGAALVFKVGEERLSIDKIPESMRAYNDATANLLQAGFAIGTQQASIADTCSDFLKKLNDGVDKDIAELKGSVGDVKDDVDDKLSAAKDATAATLSKAAEDQAKLNAALKKDLLAAVKGATEDAAEALASANGFKACDYSKQFFNKATDKCQNVKTCGSGEVHTEKPLFADWTCGAAATDCLPEAELCRANKGKTGFYTVCNDDPLLQYKVYCNMDTDGGKWTLMTNIHPADGHSVGFMNEDFWVHPGEYGKVQRALDSDYKSPAAATFKGKEILGISAAYKSHSVRGYRVWGYTNTWNSMFKLGINGDQSWSDGCRGRRTTPCKTTAAKRGKTGSTDGWDDIMRQGSCIRTDLNPSCSGWADVIRLTTTNMGRRDNHMSGFASCIDCGRPWQGSTMRGDGHEYMGMDRAMCNRGDSNNGCPYHDIRRAKGPDGSENYYLDCKGRYCDGTYRRTYVTGWTSQFYIR